MADVQPPLHIVAPRASSFISTYMPPILVVAGVALMAVGIAALKGRQSWARWPHGVPEVMTGVGSTLVFGLFCRSCFKLYRGTDIHQAIDDNDPARLGRLIRQGVDLNERWHGETPLYKSVKYERTEMVNSLLEAGADVNGTTQWPCEDDRGRTALMLAAKTQSDAMVQRLLTVPGLELDARDVYGRTALMEAAYGRGPREQRPDPYQGNISTVELLLAARADATLSDADGQTALSLATLRHHTAVIRRLETTESADATAQLL